MGDALLEVGGDEASRHVGVGGLDGYAISGGPNVGIFGNETLGGQPNSSAAGGSLRTASPQSSPQLELDKSDTKEEELGMMDLVRTYMDVIHFG